MRKSSKPHAPKAATPLPSGPVQDSQAALQMAQPKAPGGQGFLIDHNAFTDANPPGARGARKSAGYPNFIKKP